MEKKPTRPCYAHLKTKPPGAGGGRAKRVVYQQGFTHYQVLYLIVITRVAKPWSCPEHVPLSPWPCRPQHSDINNHLRPLQHYRIPYPFPPCTFASAMISKQSRQIIDPHHTLHCLLITHIMPDKTAPSPCPQPPRAPSRQPIALM